MADPRVREFDAVIIGAGQNSLVLGNYLARCGLSVVLLERKLEGGGGLISEELTVPGYWHNTASYLFDQLSVQPVSRGLGLDKYFVSYLLPDVQASMLLREGSALSLYSDLEASTRSIGSLSRRDAASYRDVLATYQRGSRDRLTARLLSPPQDDLVDATDVWLNDLARLTPRQVVEALFESEPVRVLVLMLLAFQRGVLPDYRGMGWAVPFQLDQLQHTHIVAGGSHVLAQALLRALVRAGGRYHVLRQVSRILVEGGRARGVELADGTRYLARRLVASGVDVWQTALELLPEEALAPSTRQAVRDFRPDEFCLFQVHLSLAHAPRYVAGANGDNGELSDVNRSLQVFIGPESARELEDICRDVRAGRLPDRPSMVCSTPTVLDPRQAPRGKHVGVLSQLVPYELTGGSGDAWREAREPYMERCLAWWTERAPNLASSIECRAPLTPTEQAARLTSMSQGGPFVGRNSAEQIGARRPTSELGGYRTPVDGLYLCGQSSHPGLGILGAAGYVAANVIADDLGLPRWWVGDEKAEG